MNTVADPFSARPSAELVTPQRFRTVEETQRHLKSQGVSYVLAQFVDIHGAAKAKAVPVEHLDMILKDGAGFAGFALWGFGMGPEGPDYMAVGDLSTLKPIPWMPGFAAITCNGSIL